MRAGGGSLAALVPALLAVSPVAALHGQSSGLARAEANDQRTPAGRLVDGELHVELEAVEAAWYPRGDDGPRIVTPAFAEVGRAPQVPGPLIRASAGTPIRVRIRNTLERAIVVRGLVDRAAMLAAERPPVEPGDTAHFVIAPRRAGTFMYHTHGEPGHELAQGLYGPFLVLEPDEERDTDADRVYMLASRGAVSDAAPAINGRTRPNPERFQPGGTYRLRFLQISPDEFKRVRLLRDGEPVQWRPLAKDGADLPETARELGPAEFGMGVGETYDAEWSPDEPGVYVLEVTTEFFPALGGTVVQRVAFGVGDVSESELLSAQQPAAALTALSASERAQYVGTFEGTPVQQADAAPELVLSIWEEQGRLWSSGFVLRGRDDQGVPLQLIPVGEGIVAPGREFEGLIHLLSLRYVFHEPRDGRFEHLDAEVNGSAVVKLARVAHLELTESQLARFEGAYGEAGPAAAVSVELDNGVLKLVRERGGAERLIPISSTRFGVEGRPGARVDFEVHQGRVVGLTLVMEAGERTHLSRRGEDSGANRPDTLALTNVTLIGGTGTPAQPGMTVLVHGDLIGGIFPSDAAAIPASAEVLDFGGRYLIPGLINTHGSPPNSTARRWSRGHPYRAFISRCGWQARHSTSRCATPTGPGLDTRPGPRRGPRP